MMKMKSSFALFVVNLLAVFMPSAPAAILTGNGLTVNIRNDNGAINNVQFQGVEFFELGNHVSDYGFQLGSDIPTFALNDTYGVSSQPVVVAGNTVSGTYVGGGSSIDFERTYALVAGLPVLKVETVFVNNGGPATLSYFDTYDPDQGGPLGGGSGTYNDVFSLAGGMVGQSRINTGGQTLTVIAGSWDARTTVASGNPFQINSGNALNSFFTMPFDGQDAFADRGVHIGIRFPFGAGEMTTNVYLLAFGASPEEAQANFQASGLLPEIDVKTNGVNLVSETSAVQFGGVVLQSITVTNEIEISNSGLDVLEGISLDLIGNDVADFELLASGLPATLAPGSNVMFNVTFAPGGLGERAASLRIASNDGDENPFIVSLNGVGLSPEIVINNGSAGLSNGVSIVDFGSSLTGLAKAPESFTIRNTGTGPLTGIQIQVLGSNGSDFVADTTAMATNVAAGASTSFNITFTPGALGSRSALVRVLSSDLNEGQFDIAVIGTGVEPDIEVAFEGSILTNGTASADLGSVEFGVNGPEHLFSITNTGGYVLENIEITLSGVNAADFNLSMDELAAALLPGASTTFSTAFTPGGQGLRAAQLSVSSSDGDENPFIINLTGNGVLIADIAVEDEFGNSLISGASLFDYGTNLVGAISDTKTFTIKSDGTAAITGLSINITGPGATDFIVDDSAVNSSLPVGSNTSFAVRFSPSVAGLRNAVLQVASNDPDENPFVIQLTGSGSGAGNVEQQAYLKSSSSRWSSSFGRSVAMSGDLIAVGSNDAAGDYGVNGNEYEKPTQSNSGAVRIFSREGTSWRQEAYIKASNAEGQDRFGESVALDGNIMVVGAPGERSSSSGVDGNQMDNSQSGAGAAYVFVRDAGGNWHQEAYLKASNPELIDLFGGSVGISGTTIVIGAKGEDSFASGVNGNSSDNSSIDAGAAYVFVKSNGVWMQQAYLKASNTEAGDFFGDRVSIDGDLIAISATAEGSAAVGVDGDEINNAALSSGAVYLFRRQGTVWNQEAYVKASNTGAYDQFGTALSVSGDLVAVGTAREASNETGINGDGSNNSASWSGAAYVFSRTGGIWSEAAYIKSSNSGNGDQFAWSLDLDGGVLIVGARHEEGSSSGIGGDENDNAYVYAGAAYVFVRGGTNWSQLAYLKASNTGPNDRFGNAVAVSGESVVVCAEDEFGTSVGVNGNQSNGGNQGAAYVFNLNTANRSSEIAVERKGRPDLVSGFGVHHFGSGLIQSDSAPMEFIIKNKGDAILQGISTILEGAAPFEFKLDSSGLPAVLAPGEAGIIRIVFSPVSTGPRPAVLSISSTDSDEPVFEIYLEGNGASALALSQQAYVKASNTESNVNSVTTDDFFGYSVDLYGDTMVIGAPNEDSSHEGVNEDNPDNNNGSNSGAVYVFTKQFGQWVQEAYIKGPYTGDDRFGTAVAIDGDTLVVGAMREDSNASGVNGNMSNNSLTDSGAAFVFRREQGNWMLEAYLKASNSDANDNFGEAVAVCGDIVAVGSRREASANENDPFDNTKYNAGAVYVFKKTGTQWSQKAYLKPFVSIGDPNWFGTSVAVQGNRVFVGEPGGITSSFPFNKGYVHVFNSPDGTNWVREVRIEAPFYKHPFSYFDSFGQDIDVSGDFLAVGDPLADYLNITIDTTNGVFVTNTIFNCGAAFIYEFDGVSWTNNAPETLYATNYEADDQFGGSVSLHGETLVAGARYEDSGVSNIQALATANNDISASGAAYVFTRKSDGSWEEKAYAKASNPDMLDQFGCDVSVWGDQFVVGALSESGLGRGINADGNNNDSSRSGAAYVFDLITEPTSPEIEVELADGIIAVSASATVDFGQIGLGGSVEVDFTIRNLGDGDLSGISIGFSGTDPTQFAEGTAAPTNLPPGQSTTFSVVFTPTGSDGSRSAVLEIASNDADENPFAINLTGSVVDSQQFFDGIVSGSGLSGTNALPLAEPFNDGVDNLLKYAFNMNLGGFDATRMVPGGTTGLPGGELVMEGGQTYWQVQFVRRKGSGLVYTPQKTTSLTEEAFIPMVGTATIEEIDGQWERVIINEPCDPAAVPTCFSKVEIILP